MVVIKTGYPSLGDDDFREVLTNRPDYQLFKSLKYPQLNREEFEKISKEQCSGFEKTLYQHLMQHYLSIRSPYRSLLLYHGLGVGKSCSSITIAEALLKDHRVTDDKTIYVVSTGALHKSYEGQIFSLSHKSSLEELREQCTSDHYLRLIGKTEIPKTEKERESIEREIHEMIKKRYKFITYRKFATKLEQLDKKGKLDTFRDKVIIIDEAHNLRDVDMEQTKSLTQPLIKLLRTAENNRLVLLSATPMYNEPEEILWLLSLLSMNDKRNLLDPEKLPPLFKNNKLVPSTRKLLEQFASEYISYIRGNNPFTFPLRVSPEFLGVPVLKQSITDDDVKDPYWPTYYKDGLVPTPLGSQQQTALEKIRYEGAIQQAKMKTYEQIDCISFNGKTGRSWIYDMFDVSLKPNLQFKYKEKIPWMTPSINLLGSIACKMLRICEFIRQSTGIVVVYSNYNWSGIVPIALALEHVGFESYDGSRMLHSIPSSTEYPKLPPYRFKGIINPKYAIISGNKKNIMRGNIADILQIVNDPKNQNGNKIKVVLITPVASEGLTIKNTREIHVLSPWYNINNLEQVIGRTIRTCSHILKPVEERNVTVYLHTTVANDPKTNNSIDTADLHSYRISARKLSQMNEVIEILRDNAWDCSLMKNLNYIPKDMFDFTIQMKTSQGTVFDYKYGDLPEHEPQCISHDEQVNKPKTKNKDKDFIRPDMYLDIIPTIQTRLRKFVVQQLKNQEAEQIDHVIIPIKDLPKILRLEEFPEIIQSTLRASLEKEGLLSGHRVFIHKDQVYITSNDLPKKATKIGIHIEQEVKEIPIEEKLQVFENYTKTIKNDDELVIYLYNNLYDNTWTKLAYKIIETSSENKPAWINRLSELLYREGALIHHSEYPSVVTNREYIGYYDFFQKESQLYILGANNKLREASEAEIRVIESKRKKFILPEKGTKSEEYIGIYTPYKAPRDINTGLVFKILKKDMKVRATNPGTVCSSFEMVDLREIWKSLQIKKQFPDTKADVCNVALPSVMLQKQKLFLPPLYKPNMKK